MGDHLVTVRELRPKLREAELQVARIHRGSSSKEIWSLYSLLDQIATALPKLQQAGAQLESELARFETIGAILNEKARFVVQRLAADGGLGVHRQQSPPPQEFWWWYLDRRVAQQQTAKRKRILQSALIGAAIMVVLAILYIVFLRPDEATRLRYDYQFRADSEVQQGNYQQALELYQKALKLAPEDAELILVVGVLHEALQKPENATEQYAEAEKRYETPAAFITARAQQYMRLGWYERSVQEAQAAIDLDDSYALAHCTMGSAYQGLGENQAAIAALWKCSDLASEQGRDELYVHAKMILATLMQQPS